MAFSFADLEAELKVLAPDAACCIHYNTFGILLPPGEIDILARTAALAFAEANGCIDDQPPEQSLSFIKL